VHTAQSQGSYEPAAAEVAEGGSDAILAALDPEQRQVALAGRGPVCVLAGAGTGKTRAVAHRIAYLAATAQISPGEVLAVTFTTRAAGELRGRLRQLGMLVPGTGLERVQARTFHAAALRQLTHFWPSTVGGPPPQVVDSKIGLLAEAARRLRVKTDLAALRDAAGEIEWAKVTQIRPDEYAAASAKAGRSGPLDAQALARLYGAYEALRAERNLVDFESVLELTAAILAEHPQAARSVRDRYAFFVVDEYQDVNPLQKLLLDMWLGGRDEVCVVGDPRQTIYSFTGATPAYLTGFPAEFPAAPVIRLVRNYRSTPQVVALANTLAVGASWKPGGLTAAGSAGYQTGDALVAQRPAGPQPQLTEYPDEPAEAAAIASQVAGLIRAGTPASKIAILVRTNAQTQVLEQALAQAGVAFQVRGAERFFGRAEVRQAVALVQAAARSAAADDEPASQVRAILASIGLTPQAPSGRGVARERWESLEALAALAADFFSSAQQATIADLADELAARSAIGHAPAAAGVTLASLHAAKGLEWDAVFLAGLTDGTLPIIYAQTEEAVEEERRLLYVGVTRARERLYLSWALARSAGGRRTRSPSRFLDGLLGGRAGPHRGRSAAGQSAAGQSAAGQTGPDPRRRDAGGQAADPDDPLFVRLRAWRLVTAKEQSVPAYVVFSDATLQAIAGRRPATLAQLADVPGVGAVKLDRYGAAVLELCTTDETGGARTSGAGGSDGARPAAADGTP
jgi:DNA helicase II / ATP-dependent DNA helicase PcrA